MKSLSAVIVTVLFFNIVACDNQTDESSEPTVNNPTEDTAQVSTPNTIEITGEIRHISLEGGAWIIHGSDSTRYEPLNLANEYKEEGLSVRVTAETQPDKMSFLQVGPIIRITSIEKR